ncbi:MAG: hypothetical protein WD940_02090 [Patescibacteria group bacterium]
MLLLHIGAALIGIVCATWRNAVFFKRGSILPVLQKIVWLALLTLAATGGGLLLSKPALLHSPAFWLKMFFVGGILVSEFYLARRKVIWAGFVSLFTWYFSFFWSGLERVPLSYAAILGLYFGVGLLSFLAARKYGYT